MSQLTITLDDDLLQAAQAYARQHGQELDALLTNFLRTTVRPITEPAATSPTVFSRPLSPRIQRLFGAVRVPDDFDYKRALEEAIKERFRL